MAWGDGAAFQQAGPADTQAGRSFERRRLSYRYCVAVVAAPAAVVGSVAVVVHKSLVSLQTITYSDLVHSVVALLHDNYLPHLAPHQIFQQLCHEGTRTLVVLRDSEG